MTRVTHTFAIKLFGMHAARAGTREIRVEIDHPHITANSLLQRIAQAAPAIADSVPTSRLAVDHEFAQPEATVRADQEIALIGMIGGG